MSFASTPALSGSLVCELRHQHCDRSPWAKVPPRKPLASFSTKAAESSSSHASRQEKVKTAKIKTEKEESAESSRSVLAVQKLKDDAPLYEVPRSFAVDHETQTVFFNTYDDGDKNQIYSCDLKTRTWKNITKTIHHLPHPIGSPERPQQLPSRYGGTMAFYKVQASGQRLLLLFGGQINGLKTDDLGEVSNELIAIDVDTLKWWVVDVAGGRVATRVEAHLLIFESTESYCVARFADYKWAWEVRDERYPSHVPLLGFCCNAVAIQDGDAQKILLTVGCTDSTETVDLNPTSFVLFDIGLRTFAPQVAKRGNFPRTDPASTSVVICTFHADAAQKPELYVYAPQDGCRSLGLRRRIAKTGRTFELFVVVGPKIYLFGWTREKWDIVAEIPRRWIAA
ncbi:hypothetical protein MVEN_01769100 [Mycena venus]|uniref:Uncharacterized protein n=1 Tax=Mycena venus TaxID=2733690 RepID=A0A8H6XKM2_9AGAR|nr:hypothetical protein MVEN_01769100 [Mycena venus]